ncbi:MAG: hypothetical protein RJA44_2409 [Pseudomonadota bacterium]
MTAAAQRLYRAVCPNCGGAVDFRSPASASAVCGYCRSTLLRDGETLRRIGQSAELFDDHSPLQLGAQGRYLGRPFTLVGRLQLRYADGSWNEWHALFDGDDGAAGRSAWLAEDNGAYVFSFEAPLTQAPPALVSLQAGARCLIDGRVWQVGSITTARLGAAQGELPHPPPQIEEFRIVDLRNEQGEVGTLDHADPLKPVWSIGRAVRLDELQLQGLREQPAEAQLGRRSIECPSCGASLALRLDSTRSVVCGQCKAVVDVSQGAGADLAHYAQRNGLEPQLPLGSVGTLAFGRLGPLPWQVVGYLERCDLPGGGDDEQSFWREYLLYHQREGFTFLVDAEDGWSWMRPLTGAPKQQGEQALWQGDRYQRRWRYAARTTYVLGEFYWRVRQGEQVEVQDYDGVGPARARRLSREQQGDEVIWSGGAVLEAGPLARAFGLALPARTALPPDASPLGLLRHFGPLNWPLLIFIAVVLLVLLLNQCSSDRCDELSRSFGPDSAEVQQCRRSRSGPVTGGYGGSGGGSLGGWSSSGGGHK